MAELKKIGSHSKQVSWIWQKPSNQTPKNLSTVTCSYTGMGRDKFVDLSLVSLGNRDSFMINSIAKESLQLH